MCQIDFDELKNYLEIKKMSRSFFHSNKGIYTLEILEKMCELYKINTHEFKKTFANSDEDGGYYQYESKCNECKNICILQKKKTGFINHLISLKINKKRKKWEYLCAECDEKKIKENKIELDSTIKKNTEFYIQTFLDPERCWIKGTKNGIKMREISCIIVDWKQISFHIQSMDYQDFLNTPYWKAISEKKRIQSNFQCQVCSSSDNLNVHHPNYDIHGFELQNLKFLTVLCKDCHEKFHEINI